MSEYTKLPVTIEATQWFESGDHPEDDRETFCVEGGDPFLGEGKVVRYYRHPDVSGGAICETCGCVMHDHGWIDTLEGGHTVCVGDWIITGVKGEHYPCKPEIFKMTYAEASSDDAPIDFQAVQIGHALNGVKRHMECMSVRPQSFEIPIMWSNIDGSNYDIKLVGELNPEEYLDAD